MELADLYQEIIVDHNRRPRNFREPAAHSHAAEGFNPLCGDRLKLYLQVEDGVIRDAGFQGQGCAISVASASLMTEAIKGRTPEQAEALFDKFHTLVTSDDGVADNEGLGKLAALAGVRAYPSRVKCATLCWHTLHCALHGERTATTE